MPLSAPIYLLTLLLIGSLASCAGGHSENTGSRPTDSPTQKIGINMVVIKGGQFTMGDLFGEGEESELPVHEASVSDFLIASHEVTHRQFKAFTEETGYRSSAEASPNPTRQEQLLREAMPLLQSGDDETARSLVTEFLSYSGCFWWGSEAGQFGFSAECNWQNPLFEQSDKHPVVCLSWLDAAHFCNWLSLKSGLAVAYELPGGVLLDAGGRETKDITKVVGFRLPSEVEWEFAARERGRKVRFGNGKSTASAAEIAFDASRGEFDFLQPGEGSIGTQPIGSHAPNALGLFDLSGNAWEWCTDYYQPYSNEQQSIPYTSEGEERVLRGGRWGGTAHEMRVSARAPYEQVNRCNNSGFRVARSSGGKF